MERNQPVNITLGKCKLNWTPLPSGPELEFTDFETDITWLSGPLHAVLACADAPSHFYRALDGVEWEAAKTTLRIRGRLGPLNVTIGYRLLEAPVRLEELIVVSNPTEKNIEIKHLRIGMTWSPPKSWLSVWSDWRLAPLHPEFDPSHGTSFLEVQPLGLLIGGHHGKRQLESTGRMGQEWIGLMICDNKRFLTVIKESWGRRELCMFQEETFRKRKCLVMGGMYLTKGLPPLYVPILQPNAEYASDVTVYLPGVGGFDDAVEALKPFAPQTNQPDADNAP